MTLKKHNCKLHKCKYCRADISHRNVDALYCDDRCKKADKRKKQSPKTKTVTCNGPSDKLSCTLHPKKLGKPRSTPWPINRHGNYHCKDCKAIRFPRLPLRNFYNSTHFDYVFKAALRAGTLETFTCLTDISFYQRLIKKRLIIDGVEYKEDEITRIYFYHICHRVAVGNTESGLIGCFNEANLYLGDALQNMSDGAKVVFKNPIVGIHCILERDLDPRFIVKEKTATTPQTTYKEFRKMLETLFGLDELKAWAKGCKFTKKPKKSTEKYLHPVRERWTPAKVMATAYYDDPLISNHPDFWDMSLDMNPILEHVTTYTGEALTEVFEAHTALSDSLIDYIRTGSDEDWTSARDYITANQPTQLDVDANFMYHFPDFDPDEKITPSVPQLPIRDPVPRPFTPAPLYYDNYVDEWNGEKPWPKHQIRKTITRVLSSTLNNRISEFTSPLSTPRWVLMRALDEQRSAQK